MRVRTVAVGLAAAMLASGAAQARERYFTYEPDSDAARYRSQEITLVIEENVLGRRVLKLYRTRGKELRLEAPKVNFSERALSKLVDDGEDLHGLQFYAVNLKDGEGFARGACKGADRAWVAMTPVKPYQALRIYVLKLDPQTKGPALCETLAYRYRAEWQLPPHANLSKSEGEAEGDGGPEGPH
jgi:hypothetical protein